MTSAIQGSAYGPAAGSGAAQWRQAQFKAADTDQDGQITRDELVLSLIHI